MTHMKRLPLFCLCAAIFVPDSLTAQELFMKNGSRFAVKNPRRQGDMLFLSVVGPGGVGSAEVGYKLGDIEKADMPVPPALNSARSLLFLGKPAEAAKAIKPAYDEISPLRGIPGSNWDEVALMYAAALQAGGQIPEAVAILDQFEASTPKGSPAREIARLRLAGMKNPQDFQAVTGIADQAIAAKLGAGVEAEANTVAGDVLLANRSFDEALTRFLRVVIFCPGDRWLGARSLLGAAKAMAALDEKKNCVRTLREISSSFPGSPQAEAAAKMMAAGGDGYALLATELDNDEAAAKKRLIDASAEQPSN